MLALEPLEPAALVGAGQLRRRRPGEVEVGPGVTSSELVGLAAFSQPLEGEGTDRVRHREPDLAVRLGSPDQALVGQVGDPVEDVAPELLGRSADQLGRLQVAAAAEAGQALEQVPARLVEQVVAPGDRAAQGALPLGHVARPGGEQLELALQPGEDRVGRQKPDAGRRQLDRQRHAVEAGADPGHCHGVGPIEAEARASRHRPLDEQPDGVVAEQSLRLDRPRRRSGPADPPFRREPVQVGWHGQPVERELVLAGQVEDRPAGDHEAQSRARPGGDRR